MGRLQELWRRYPCACSPHGQRSRFQLSTVRVRTLFDKSNEGNFERLLQELVELTSGRPLLLSATLFRSEIDGLSGHNTHRPAAGVCLFARRWVGPHAPCDRGAPVRHNRPQASPARARPRDSEMMLGLVLMQLPASPTALLSDRWKRKKGAEQHHQRHIAGWSRPSWPRGWTQCRLKVHRLSMASSAIRRFGQP
jgi:hypothetical protein